MASIKESGRNGVLICDLCKIGNKWTIKARNYFTKNTLTSDDAVPIVEKVLNGDSSDVRIISINK